MNPIIFFVPGIAKPAGSKNGFALKKDGVYTGRVAITDASKGSKGWKKVVALYARMHYHGPLFDVPLEVSFRVLVPRPKWHYGTGKNSTILKADAPAYPAVKPDVLKLARGIEDALTQIVWVDDSLIVTELLTKRYDPTPGVLIRVQPVQEIAQETEADLQQRLF